MITVSRILFLALFLLLVQGGKMMLWLGLFGLSLVGALFFGRFYCGYVCPMNTVMLPAEWLSKKLRLQSERVPKWLQSGKVAWFALALSVLAMLLAKRVFRVNLPILLLWLLAAPLLTLRYRPEVFHNLLCPFGALQRLAGGFARFSRHVHPETCIGCKRCERVCPSGAIKVDGTDKRAKIDVALCHQCTSCQQTCPVSAIHYGKTRLGNDSSGSAVS